MAVTILEGSELAKLMSASVAPVFLVTGVAGLLSIMSSRYGRVIDRIRTLLREGPKLYHKETGPDYMNRELQSLYRRARILRTAIIFEVLSVFSVSITIVALFSSMSYQIDFYYTLQFFFVLALLLLMLGLALFIKDFAVSLKSIELDMQERSNVEVEDVKNESVFKPLE